MSDPTRIPLPAVVVQGRASDAFAPLADALGRAVAAQGGGGAALAVRHRGAPVVDLVAGEYAVDSLQLLFSVSKAVTAVAAARASEEGLLDLDAPVGDAWPAFAKRSTRSLTTRMVLSHRAGLPAVDRPLTLDELLAGREAELLEVQEPYWEPGTRHGYHAVTFGTLVDGVFQRALGMGVGSFVADRIATPLSLDLWIGLPESALPRVRPISYSTPRTTAARAAWAATSGIPLGSTAALQRATDLYNDPRLARAALPSTSGIGDARSLAALFAVILDGGIIGAEARTDMVTSRARGLDAVLGVEMNYGSGVQRPFPALPMLGSTSFGHEAAGGSAVVADPESGLVVAFTTDVFPPSPGAALGFLSIVEILRMCAADAR